MYQGRQLTNVEKGAIIGGVLELISGSLAIFYPDPKFQAEMQLVWGVLTFVLLAFGITLTAHNYAVTREMRLREIARDLADKTAIDRGLNSVKLQPPIDDNPMGWVLFAKALGWAEDTAVVDPYARARLAKRFVVGKYRLMKKDVV